MCVCVCVLAWEVHGEVHVTTHTHSYHVVVVKVVAVLMCNANCVLQSSTNDRPCARAGLKSKGFITTTHPQPSSYFYPNSPSVLLEYPFKSSSSAWPLHRGEILGVRGGGSGYGRMRARGLAQLGGGGGLARRAWRRPTTGLAPQAAETASQHSSLFVGGTVQPINLLNNSSRSFRSGLP